MSGSLPHHGLQHARLPCPPLSPRVCSNSCLLSQWCYLSHPLLPPSFTFNLSPHQCLFHWVYSLHIRWPRFWSFSFSISTCSEYSRLISLTIDWFDIVVQGTLKSLLQHHTSKASILWCSAFFVVQLSHPYMTTGQTIALIIQTFVGKVISLLFNMLSRFVTVFLPRSQCLCINWRNWKKLFDYCCLLSYSPAASQSKSAYWKQ